MYVYIDRARDRHRQTDRQRHRKIVCVRACVYAARMLTYVDVSCSTEGAFACPKHMLTYADVCWRMLTYADVC